jgi:thymidylate synthase (FAD)
MSIKVTYIDHMGSDLTVANAARVSFGKTSEMEDDPWGPPRLKKKDDKLIRYLAREKHISPFGHCFASFHVKAPIFVARQLVKHKFLRWNEISRRYVDDEPEFYTPDAWRGRSADKKQGSDGVVSTSQSIMTSSSKANMWSLRYYQTLLNQGVAPEQARMVLPQSTMTEWYWSGSLDAFADMCRLRITPDTQYESRQVALGVDKIMLRIFPVSWEALEGYGND